MSSTYSANWSSEHADDKEDTANMISMRRLRVWSRSYIHIVWVRSHTTNRYENISKLITQLERSFESQGWAKGRKVAIDHNITPHFARFLWICDRVILTQQRGVYRMNCIDCLDRTNVVQVSSIVFSSAPVGSQMIVRFRSTRTKSAIARLGFVEPFRVWWYGNGCCFQRWYDIGLGVHSAI